LIGEGGGRGVWGRVAEEDDCAVDSDDFAEEEKKLLEEGRGIEAVGEESGETAKGFEALDFGVVGDGGGDRSGDLGWRGGGYGEMFWGEDSIEEGIDDGAADGFMEDAFDAEKVGIIFPERRK
jgi:hypothetical protein